MGRKRRSDTRSYDEEEEEVPVKLKKKTSKIRRKRSLKIRRRRKKRRVKGLKDPSVQGRRVRGQRGMLCRWPRSSAKSMSPSGRERSRSRKLRPRMTLDCLWTPALRRVEMRSADRSSQRRCQEM